MLLEVPEQASLSSNTSVMVWTEERWLIRAWKHLLPWGHRNIGWPSGGGNTAFTKFGARLHPASSCLVCSIFAVPREITPGRALSCIVLPVTSLMLQVFIELSGCLCIFFCFGAIAIHPPESSHGHFERLISLIWRWLWSVSALNMFFGRCSLLKKTIWLSIWGETCTIMLGVLRSLIVGHILKWVKLGETGNEHDEWTVQRIIFTVTQSQVIKWESAFQPNGFLIGKIH